MSEDLKNETYGIPESVKRNRPISLRDQFAMAALNGCLSHSDKGNVSFASVKDATDYYAKLAYAYADAMLKARGK